MQIDCLILPVAPQVVTKVRFSANYKAAPALLPAEAINWIGDLIKGGKQIRAVDIHGPGDPLGTPEVMFKTLDLLHESYPDIEPRITTLGLGASQCSSILAEKGVKQVNLQVDALDPAIISKIYAWIRPGKKTIPLIKALDLLIDGQKEAVTSLHSAGLTVNIQTCVYPGINDQHIPMIGEAMATLGADSITLVPFQTEETDENTPEDCDESTLAIAKEQAAKYLKISEYDKDLLSPPQAGNFQTTTLPQPSNERPNVAVTSSNGMDVDLHLGQATQLLIYGPRADGLACLLETRMVPSSTSGTSRWQQLAEESLHDCFALLSANAGDNPRNVLADMGVSVLITDENIEGSIDVLFGGGKKKKCKK